MMAAWRAALLAGLMLAAQHSAALNVAFYYGEKAPRDALKAFDAVVVEPDHVRDPRALAGPRTEIFAYVSVGEVQAARPYFGAIDPSWKIGQNRTWDAVVVDQRPPAWHRFFVERVIAPLWEQGYRGFFLDTLTSYHLIAKTPEEHAAHEDGMVALIKALKARFPEAKLILNRGFELLPKVRTDVMAVAAESLYRRWDQVAKRYEEVPAADREWLLGQLRKVADEHRLPVIAIDYVNPKDRALARQTAERIRSHGFVPYVADPDLLTLGVGNIEVMPRRVLLVYDARDADDLQYHTAQVTVAMPLNHLGYSIDYLHVGDALPSEPLNGRYAAIVTWLRSDRDIERTGYPAWLKRQVAQGMRVVIFQSIGFRPDGELLEMLGLRRVTDSNITGLRFSHRDPIVGFEHMPRVDPGGVPDIVLAGPEAGTPIIRLTNDAGVHRDAAAITPAGGFVLYPYVITRLPGLDYDRWNIEPLAFLRRALVPPDMPVPDVTTENGLRLMLVHIDGDGMPSRVERPGSPLAAQVLLAEVLERYRVPTTVSVIEGEISPGGLHKEDSTELEGLARRMFALAHVEAATHTYSHPFNWRKAVHEAHVRHETPFYLQIPGYVIDVDREIVGSRDYINRALLPPGKRTQVMLWSGDCVVPAEALEKAYRAGLLNMNGGHTLIMRSRNSWTQIAPLGVRKGDWFQVYAPHQNENLYTNLWRGPFYGFQRVIETFELTGEPIRFKPINIYYHTYSVTKQASIVALHKAYEWALAQPVMNIFGSEYIRKVLDFDTMTIARDWLHKGWRVRGRGDLRTLRIGEADAAPDFSTSEGVAGIAPGPRAQYIHLTGAEAFIREAAGARVPHLATANGRIVEWRREGRSIVVTFESHLPLALAFGDAEGCELIHEGRVIRPKRTERERKTYALGESGRQRITLRCS